MSKVYLGGTTGTNTWRQDVAIPGLVARGVALERICNPVPSGYRPLDPPAPDTTLADPDVYKVYVIAALFPSVTAHTPIQPSVIVEALMSLYDQPERTVIMIDVSGLSKLMTRDLAKMAADIYQRFPQAALFDAYAPLLDWLAKRLAQEEEANG